MTEITVILPDTIPVMSLFNFAQDNGLRPYWKNANTVEMRPVERKVVPFRERHGVITPTGAIVVPQDDPEPPRAA